MMLYFNDEAYMKLHREKYQYAPTSYKGEISSHIYNALLRIETLHLGEEEWVKTGKIAIAIAHMKEANRLLNSLSFDNEDLNKQFLTEKKD
jgi:hypothetical protein